MGGGFSYNLVSNLGDEIMFEKIWSWHGWTIVKWPFGLFILWLVLFLIYNVNINPQYDKKVISDIKSIKLTVPTIILSPSEKIKNVQ